ncbi:MAG: hypothetical protein ACHQVS_01235 [Candidatus Babeliales bacterium]
MKRIVPAYIMIVTLMIISVSVVLVTYLTHKSRVYFPYAHMVVDRYQARALAFGGVQIAMSQLAAAATPKKKETSAQQQADKTKAASSPATSQDAVAKDLLSALLPIKNRWQTITLTKEREGINAQLKLCIVCEDGKININKMYDFEKRKFVGEGNAQGDYKKIMQELFTRIEKKLHAKDLFVGFEKFLKDRQYMVNDASELWLIKAFKEAFKKDRVWYQPPLAESSQKKEQRTLYLTDIFTVWSAKEQLQPWLLSDSLCALFDLKRAESNEMSKERISELVKNFKRVAQWPADWKQQLKPLYDKDSNALPQTIMAMLNPTFEPTTFSVLSYASVGKITQTLLAIIELKPASEDAQRGVVVTMKKVYWL